MSVLTIKKFITFLTKSSCLNFLSAFLPVMQYYFSFTLLKIYLFEKHSDINLFFISDSKCCCLLPFICLLLSLRFI